MYVMYESTRHSVWQVLSLFMIRSYYCYYFDPRPYQNLLCDFFNPRDIREYGAPYDMAY